ncbi:MAG TPA: hypothetical protein VM425_09155 [Myxococcota bacterium]|nr:hypothetical protein [Myxococcota bacterium]
MNVYGRLGLLAALMFLFHGCLNDGSGNQDSGPECKSNDDCTLPKTCQPDGTCLFIDPDANRATGTFELRMNSSSGSADVSGKLDGKGFFMNIGGQVQFDSGQGVVTLEIYGVLTSNLLNGLTFELPTDPPLNQEVKFGASGVADGTFDLINIDNDGYETSRHSTADITGGGVTFTKFSLTSNQAVEGSLDIQLKSR